MTLGELMRNRTLDASYDGQITADDMVLAVNLDGSDDVNDYFVAQPFITEHSGAIESESTDSRYIRSGATSTRTGASRVITVNGDRYVGDEFQDALLAYDMLYGRGSTVVKDYVYFAIQNGKGEKGQVTIDVTADASGAAGENSSFSATLTSLGTPAQYTYTKI